ncbi:MAG: anti-sigma factor family protein [Candidatus Acidiferrales bacterium]
MSCRTAGKQLAGYLDGALDARTNAQVREHLQECGACREDLERYRRLAMCLGRTEAVAAPADLALQIRMKVSQERARRANSFWPRAWLVFENILRPLAVPATGGVITAMLAFVIVAQSLFVGLPLGAVPNDLPTKLLQPARVESLAPFAIPGTAEEGGSPSSLVVECTLNAQGQVVDYEIVAGPKTAAVRHALDQVLLFSRFRPELSFGRPVAGGRLMLSFSEVRVRG